MLYRAQVVPVGEDQLPHLELSRQIVRRFNNLYPVRKSVFLEPQALLTESKRLLGLDGRKMSKSYNNYIALSDEPEVIAKKVQSMFTDPLRIRLSDVGHPEKCNVRNYYAIFVPGKKKEIDERCSKADVGCTECKKELGEVLINFLEPVQNKRKELLENKDEIMDILKEGDKIARSIASQTMNEVRELINL
jgi:tryptophanyl-tRNA synthetase